MEENEDNLSPQYVDRYPLPKDLVRYSVHIPRVRDEIEERYAELKINRALHEMLRDGGGPIHINLTTIYSEDFSVDKLPDYRDIRRYTYNDVFPDLDIKKYSKIAISCSSKWNWNNELQKKIDVFCERYGAVVLTDHTSGYHGKYSIMPTILACQEKYNGDILSPDLLIHIGEYTGDYYTYYRLMNAKEVWRVSEDGIAKDTFYHLTKVFDMKEECFFERMTSNKDEHRETIDLYRKTLIEEVMRVYERFPDIPFSNIYVAKTIVSNLPHNSVVHFGMSNTLRSWTFFDMPYDDIRTYANVGCRGIDGVLSTLVGASFVKPDCLYFGVLGDLAFFYDMNILGNRHIGNNLRIILINNDGGTEFYLHQSGSWKSMRDDVGGYVAASGHNGKKSKELVRDYALNLGFEYLSASNEVELKELVPHFTDPNYGNGPILLEVFTEHDKEREALYSVRNIVGDNKVDLLVNSVGDWNHLRTCYEYISKIKKYVNNRDVYIYGAGRGGRIVLKVLEENNIKVCGFYDKSSQEKCMFQGYPVRNPEDALGRADRQFIVISLMKNNRKTAIEISNYLREKGYDDFDMLMI